MNNVPPEILSLMTTAAELRATGTSWEKIAARVRRSPRTCRRWRETYPEAWRRLYHDAEEELLNACGAESALVLRNLLRSEDEKVRSAAGRNLLGVRMRMRSGEDRGGKGEGAAKDPNAQAIALFLAEHDEAAVLRLVDELLERRQRNAAAAGPG